MTKILGMGNALVDIMTRVDSDAILTELALPKGSMQLVDTTFSDRVLAKTQKFNPVMTSGGSAANTIHGLARLGIGTGFIGKVGRDELGNFFKSDLIAAGITPHLLESNTPSGKAIALVTPDSERSFATFLGAAVELSAYEIDKRMFKDYQIFHIEGYLVQNHELIETAVRLAKECGLLVSLDLASYNVVESNLGFLKHIVEHYVDIVFANEDEAKAFTGLEAHEAIHALSNISKIAIVKVGKKGSLIKTENKLYTAGIIPVNAIDTTGAGDLYASGFLSGLAHNKSIDECARLGALLAGKVIENLGAKISEEGWKFVMENK